MGVLIFIFYVISRILQVFKVELEGSHEGLNRLVGTVLTPVCLIRHLDLI